MISLLDFTPYTDETHLSLHTNLHSTSPTLSKLPHGSKSSFPPHGSRRCTGDSKLYVSPNIPFPVSVLSISLLHNPLPLQDLHTEVSQCFRPTNLDDKRMTAHICIFHRRDDFPSLPFPPSPTSQRDETSSRCSVLAVVCSHRC